MTQTFFFLIDLCSVYSDLSHELFHHPAVSHALKISRAWYTGHYQQFFKLYPQTPNHGRHLVDLFIARERKAALKTIAKAWVASLDCSWVDCMLFCLGRWVDPVCYVDRSFVHAETSSVFVCVSVRGTRASSCVCFTGRDFKTDTL